MEQNKLGTMPISKLIFNMSLPIIASMLVQALYNIVDSMFVAMLSQDALTAVSLAFSAQQLMIGLATGTAVGVNALMGRALGARNQERADKVAINGVFLAFCGFVISATLGLLFSNALFTFQTKDQNIIHLGNQYLHVICGCSFGIFGQVMFERLLQGTGRTIYSMYTQGLGAIINLILDPIFIFDTLDLKLFTLHGFGLGVSGAAIATVIGQCCGCALALFFNIKINKDIHLSLKGFRPNWSIIGNIYAIGLPSVIMMAIGSVMTFLMNKILITYHSAHETAATAFGIFFKLNSFVFMPVFGLNNGVVPIVAYNYGAQQRKRMTDTVKRSVIYATCIMVFGMIIFLTIPQILLKIFSAGDELMSVGVPCLRIISLSFCMAGTSIALISVLQALGKSVYSMITSFVRQLVVLIPTAFVLARYGASIGNSNLVWWCYPIAEIFALTMTLFFYRHVYKTLIAKIPLYGPENSRQEL
ncbi:MAG: MATE family efflux transporter [Clostridiales bacterium]|nr:MATE family efflux transporter [Candidatus Cacconaster stercorequi]